MIDLAEIARAIDPKARRDGDGWVVCCPSHDDNEPSLFLSLKDGRLLWFCRAGCDQATVQSALRKLELLEARGGADRRTKPAQKDDKDSDWLPIVPAPEDAPEPAFTHHRHGKPSVAWTYRDSAGRVLFYVARFDLPDGRKEMLPRCYGTLRGNLGWHWKAPPEPRPLYRLNELAKRPATTPVFIVEGEKTAAAAAKVIEDHVCMTWQGGSKAVAKADWSAVRGRHVVVWPDADEPGRKAAMAIGKALQGIAATVRIVDPPPHLPKGWDLADPPPDGLDIRALLEQASTFDATATTDQPDDRPEGVCVTGGSLAENVRTAERLLAEASRNNPPTGVYQRGGMLMRIVRLPECSQAGGIRRAAHSMQIFAAGSDYLRLRLTDITPWLRFDARSNKWRQIDAPAEVARTLAEIAGMWPNTPTLAGIVEAPTMRPDGSILDRPGYDEATGLYFDPGSTDFATIPAHPTRRQAEAALNKLLEIIAEFPFVDEPSRSVILALLITPMIRHAVRAAPIFGISAPKMASGKTLLAHLPAYIATGHPPSLMAQADDPQEEKKRLLALLLEGSVVSVIDNCERPLRSDALCTALTETTMRDRVLGSTRTLTVPTTTTWIATGNNLLIDGDLCSRALLCSLDPQCERPEERQFRVDLHAEVPKRRGELAAAALSITRAYLAANAPRSDIPTFGRFETWSRYVREPLVWLGMSDPYETRAKIRARDWVSNALGNFLEAWHETFDEAPQTVAAAIDSVKPEIIAGVESPLSEKQKALRTALETFGLDRGKLNARKTGNFLSKHEGRIERGYRAEQAGKRSGAVLWSVSSVSLVSSAYTHAGNCQDYARAGARENDISVGGTRANSSNSSNSPSQPNGHAREPVGTCPHCRFAVFSDNAVETRSGEWLHPTCVSAWAKQ